MPILEMYSKIYVAVHNLWLLGPLIKIAKENKSLILIALEWIFIREYLIFDIWYLIFDIAHCQAQIKLNGGYIFLLL